MARYNTRLYNTFLYGQGFVAGLTVEPFEALAVDYDRVVLRYTQPSGLIKRFRIVRSQEGIPETQEDGILVVDEVYETEPFAEAKVITDGDGVTPGTFIPFTPGQYVYYAAWALVEEGWVLCGTTFTVMVREGKEILEDGTELADTHTKLLSLLPRLYTSEVFDPLDDINYSSDLARFLFGFSYSLDELLTYIDLLIPDYTQRNLSPSRLEFKSAELGISPENRPSTKQQKRLVRDAIPIYSEKGTPRSLERFVQDLTGFDVSIDISPNLLLSIQDSTFQTTIGNWKTYGNCVLTSVRNVIPPTEENSVDSLYSGKVVISDEYSRIANGVSKPLLYGIPVDEGNSYTLSFYHSYLNQESGVSVTASVQWFDYRGTKINQEQQETPIASTDEWTKNSFTVIAPEGAIRAGIEILFDGTGTVYVDMVQFAVSTVEEYYEPRQAIVTLFPTKKNLLVNPSFETFTEPGEEDLYGTFLGWEVTASDVTQELYTLEEVPPAGVLNAGNNFAQITTVTEGTTTITTVIEPREFECFWYTFSAYIRSVDGATPLTIGMVIEDVNPDATLESSIKEESILVTDEWQRFSVTACVSGMFIDEKITAYITGETGGQTLQIDMAQIEPKFSTSDYFDGNHITLGSEWEAEAHESESYLYENIGFKMIRLFNEIEDFLPTNTPYVVKTITTTEFSGVA
jgi:hypothetical protein